ncbi:MAG TPA: hypothetical protein VG188_01540 [Solirubrobacteraceae bacterium]|nr:hypothetical protein [Solirubrobacteraceae bacterium]
MTSASARGQADAPAASADRPARVVFALLVLACFVAFFLTQHLKHTPTAVQSFKLTPYFSPTPAGHIKAERISFKLAQADEVTATIVSASGATIATLLAGVPVARYKQLSLRWNGRTGRARKLIDVTGPRGARVITPENTGRAAPAGEYRVRVSLRAQQRTVLSPRGFKLVRP